ncbi:MAG: circularly permuted type 2 ATP-grasp protein, partial [Mesorhizobium sp.]
QEQTADEREALASRILANFMAGIQDEEELVSLSRLPLGRSHMS